MELDDPEIVKKIIRWQKELRQDTGNQRVILMAFKQAPTHEKIDIKDLMNIVCDVIGVPIKSLSSKSRKRELVVARHLISYFGVSVSAQTLTSIGAQMNKDHTTIIHGRETIKDLLEVGDEVVCTAVAQINKRLQEKRNAD
jgi:chromosomal replication initiation ATPase DnaA